MNNIKILLALIALLSCGVITSCDDEEAGSGQVELLSFGPAGVTHGDEIRFIGKNLHKVTAVLLPGVDVTSDDFTEHTTELIRLTVPVDTEEGIVILATPNDRIESKTVLNLNVPLTVASIPAEARPGSTITITGDFMNWVKEVWFAEDKVVTTFVSRSLHELVLEVPIDAQTGNVVLIGGGTDPVTIETGEELVVTLPSITGLAPNPVERGANLTIAGENLDLTIGVLFKGMTDPVTDFVSVSPTELVVTVPEEANKGAVTLVAPSLVQVVSAEVLELAGDLPPLEALAAAIYIDALENGFGDWSGGGAVDKSNTDNVRDGAASVKKTFNGSWDAVWFAGSSISTEGMTEFVFSVYGDVGTGDQVLNVIINGNWGIQTIVVTEGEWVEHKFTLDAFGSPAAIENWGLQAQGTSGVIYVDHIGLR